MKKLIIKHNGVLREVNDVSLMNLHSWYSLPDIEKRQIIRKELYEAQIKQVEDDNFFNKIKQTIKNGKEM